MPIVSPRPTSRVLRFPDTPLAARRFAISGTTLDSAMAPLAGCRVDVFETPTRLLRGSTTSDANGAYVLDVTGVSEAGQDYIAKNGAELAFFCVSTSPDGLRAGATINTLAGTPL